MKGRGFFGTPSILASTANEEVIQRYKPTGETIPLRAYNLIFKNQEACTIKVNGGNPIYLPAKENFYVANDDVDVETLVIVEEGIHYNIIGSYI